MYIFCSGFYKKQMKEFNQKKYEENTNKKEHILFFHLKQFVFF